MDGNVVRLRGLPWSATPKDVAEFFEGSEPEGGHKGIHLTQTRDGRATGEAFVEFVSEEDVKTALEKSGQHIGSRYIEVFRSKKSEMDWVVRRMGPDNNDSSDACVKLRGLPFGCSKEEIAQFFSGMEIVPNGIMLPEDRLGRSTGEAFVQFASQAVAEKALGKHKERIGHRYIEIFKSGLEEAHAIMGGGGRGGFRGMGRPGPYDRGDRFGGAGGNPMAMAMGMGMGMGMGRGRGGRNMKGYYDESDSYSGGGGGFGFGGRGGGGGGRYGMMQNRGGRGHWVRMRGLPFQAREQDVFEFFAPAQPLRVEFDCNESGRPSGSANVEFANHDEAQKAMRKHKSNMQHRYIELFLNSSPDDGGSFGNSGMGMGGGYSGDNMGMGNSMNSGAFGSAGGNMGGAFGSAGGNMGGAFSTAGGNMGGAFSSAGGNMGGAMGSAGGNMGGAMGSAGGNMGGAMGSAAGNMGAFASAGGNMGGGYSSGMMGDAGNVNMGGTMNMGGSYGGQEGGQYSSSGQYNSNSNMGSSSYMGNGGGYMGNSGSGQGSSYGNQGYNMGVMPVSGYNMGGGGGGYSNTSDPNYMAF